MTNKKYYIKSPLNYTGGKFSLLDFIIPKLPKDINTFVDLFAGGFNVGINTNANKIVCNDHNKFLIEMFQYFKSTEINIILNEIYSIIKKFSLSDQNKDGYLALRKEYNKIKSPLFLFVLTCFSFNHQIRFNNSHEFNTPFGLNRSKYNQKIEENLIKFCEKLKEKDIEFSTLNFENFDFTKLTNKDFVYLDPPYLISQASYNDGKRGFKDWTEREEKELIKIIQNLDSKNIKFMLSNVLENNGNKNLILSEGTKNFNVQFIEKDYANCNYQRKNKLKTTKEVLITNF